MPVNIPITAHDSFLTLVTTDGEKRHRLGLYDIWRSAA